MKGPRTLQILVEHSPIGDNLKLTIPYNQWMPEKQIRYAILSTFLEISNLGYLYHGFEKLCNYRVNYLDYPKDSEQNGEEIYPFVNRSDPKPLRVSIYYLLPGDQDTSGEGRIIDAVVASRYRHPEHELINSDVMHVFDCDEFKQLGHKFLSVVSGGSESPYPEWSEKIHNVSECKVMVAPIGNSCDVYGVMVIYVEERRMCFFSNGEEIRVTGRVCRDPFHRFMPELHLLAARTGRSWDAKAWKKEFKELPWSGCTYPAVLKLINELELKYGAQPMDKENEEDDWYSYKDYAALI